MERSCTNKRQGNLARLRLLQMLVACVLLMVVGGLDGVSGQAAETFQLASLAARNITVDAETSVIYQLQIRRATAASSQTVIEEGDYLILEVPTTTTTATWNTATTPKCSVSNGGKAKKCEIISKSQAKITFSAQSNLVLHGTVSAFMNPHSIKGIAGIQASLYSKRAKLKVLASSLSLNTLIPSSMTVKLASSSKLVGAKGQTLTIQIDPWARLTASGFVVLSMPDYYQGANNDFMIASRKPTPCGCDRGRVLGCAFSSRQKQLTIRYQFSDGQDYGGVVKFTVGQFSNPVVDRLGGFKVELLDAEEYTVAETESSVAMLGITEAASFKNVDFNYVDFPHSGKLAVH